MSATSYRRPLGLVAIASATALVQACAFNGLSFVHDNRVSIQTPLANESVELPLNVRWTASDVDEVFGVFFDRSPMRPGQTLLSLVPADDPCRSRPGCPDEQWLAEHNVYVTLDTALRVERLPDSRDTPREKDRHDVTIVLLDRQGRRVGESAFTREFIVERGK